MKQELHLEARIVEITDHSNKELEGLIWCITTTFETKDGEEWHNVLLDNGLSLKMLHDSQIKLIKILR